jgi:fluoride exporter
VTVLLVAVAAALGAAARYTLQVTIESRWRGPVPWGTWVVNVVGSFALGLLVGVADRWGLDDDATTVLGSGVLGAFTTFSTYAYESVRLLQRQRYAAAVSNAAGSLGLAIVAAAAGLTLGSHA